MRAHRRKGRPRVAVLRIGHRPGRDPRLSTHVALAARAFGAERMFLSPPDPALSARLESVGSRWGGDFVVEGVDDWKRFVRAWDGRVVHLTMYGQPLARVLPRLQRANSVLLAVGGAKVPRELFSLADDNVAVGHQPHSEVAAVAVVLERLFQTTGPRRWAGAERRILPSARGKKVVNLRERRPK